jgi:hypothetical protein
MSLFRAIRLSHQLRVRRMLQHYVARRNRQTAPLASITGSPTIDAGAVSGAGGILTKRGRKRKLLRRSAQLTSKQIVDAVHAASESASARQSGAAKVRNNGLNALVERTLGSVEGSDTVVATTPAQNRAARKVLRVRLRRNRRRAALLVGAPLDGPPPTPVTRAYPSRAMKAPSAALLVDDGVDPAMVSPSHPYFVYLTLLALRHAPEAMLPPSYYTASRPASSRLRKREAAGLAAPRRANFDTRDTRTAKSVQRAAARSAYFTMRLQERSCDLDISATLESIRIGWRALTARQKNAYVPESVRATLAVAPHVDGAAASSSETKDEPPPPASHIARIEDDCMLQAPLQGQRLHHIDKEAEALPHFHPLQPRSFATRVVRTSFQLFVDAHIDTARAEVEDALRRRTAASSSSKVATDAAAATVIEDDVGHHAVTMMAVKSLADGWLDLRAVDRHAYAAMAEGFSATSRKYFDEAFGQLRAIHRTPGGSDDADPSLFGHLGFDSANDLTRSLLGSSTQPRSTMQKGARPRLGETAGVAAERSWERLPISPVVKRRQERRMAAAAAM